MRALQLCISEATISICSLVAVGLAVGLHRDPGTGRLGAEGMGVVRIQSFRA